MEMWKDLEHDVEGMCYAARLIAENEDADTLTGEDEDLAARICSVFGSVFIHAPVDNELRHKVFTTLVELATLNAGGLMSDMAANTLKTLSLAMGPDRRSYVQSSISRAGLIVAKRRATLYNECWNYSDRNCFDY